jgi:asparagine synthase (glutamine-hydrolysing)
MCGIAGFWAQGAFQHNHGDAVRRMTSAIAHRGPDGAGQWIDTQTGIALGHRRLAILDLSREGDQPMRSASGRYIIVFNGEIYNFEELRAELPGQRWRGHSDTEVLLAAFDRWGIAASLPRVAGMFAIAVFDTVERRLHFIRDRLGEKPLYYGWLGPTLLFGSELKALRAFPGWNGTINRDAVSLYLRHNYIPAPHSIYRSVHKVLPGTMLSFNADAAGSDPVLTEYWSAVDVAVRGCAGPIDASEPELVDELDRQLRRTIRQEMVADVPLGAFLSGGIDSSLIVALMQREASIPVRTFTIGFNESQYNEAHHAKAVAEELGTDHTELFVTPDEAMAVIPRLPTLYDEPFADASQIPTFLVSSLARRHVTVSLSGDGGDELFGGYHRYFHAEQLWRGLGRIPAPGRRWVGSAIGRVHSRQWDAMLSPFRSVMPARYRNYPAGDRIHRVAEVMQIGSPEALYHRVVSGWLRPEQVALGSHEPPTLLSNRSGWPPLDGFFSQMMCLDAITYLPDDILVKVDRASMGVSLESRAPFLDHRIFEFAWRMPLRSKTRNGVGKLPLRTLLRRLAPRSLTERPKMGFGVPLDRWLRGPLRAWADDLLDERQLRHAGYFDPTIVRQHWLEHLSGSSNWQYQLWDILMFEAWRRQQAEDHAMPAAAAS